MFLAIDIWIKENFNIIYLLITVFIYLFALSLIVFMLKITKKLSDFSVLKAMAKTIALEAGAIVVLSVIFAGWAAIILYVLMWHFVLLNLDIFLIFLAVKFISIKSQKDL